ncbi:hypothetical protein ASD79_19755 [Caulobacter sp. Root655]|nr:hypothetical protein ASD79_19755 [Caulobacter sp. Root655]
MVLDCIKGRFVADYLRVINPTTPLDNVADATTAARAGALGAFLLAASGAIGGLIVIFTAESYAAKLRHVAEAMYGQGSEIARASAVMMTPALVYMSAAMSLLFALGIAVLGVVQWRKLTRLIPLILGLLTLYGLLMLGLGKINGNPTVADMQIPLWREVLSVVVNLVAIALFYAGFRGGNWLSKQAKADRAG